MCSLSAYRSTCLADESRAMQQAWTLTEFAACNFTQHSVSALTQRHKTCSALFSHAQPCANRYSHLQTQAPYLQPVQNPKIATGVLQTRIFEPSARSFSRSFSCRNVSGSAPLRLQSHQSRHPVLPVFWVFKRKFWGLCKGGQPHHLCLHTALLLPTAFISCLVLQP